MKKLVSLSLVLMLLLALLPAVVAEGTLDKAIYDGYAKGGKLFGYVGEGRHAEAVGKAIEVFEANNPGWTVEVEIVPDVQTKAKVALAAGEEIDFFWSPGSDWARIWGEMEALVPLDPFIEDAGINIYDVFEAGYADELSYNGQHIILPTDCFSYALWYNKVLFDKAGVPYPKYNESYSAEEFLDVAKKTTMDTDGDGAIDVWGISLYSPTWHIVQPFYNAFGARIISEDGQTATGFINSEAFTSYVKYYSDLMNVEKVARPMNLAPADDSWAETWTNGFLAGKTAMLVGAPWTINEAEKMELDHPELFQWGTTMIPRFGGLDETYSIGGTAGYAMPVNCPPERQLAAFKFIWEASVGAGAEWWYTQNMMYATKAGLDVFMNADPNKYGGWTEMTKHLVPMEQINVPAWADAVEPILKDTISAAFYGKMTPEEAVAQAAEKMDLGIKEYNARQ